MCSSVFLDKSVVSFSNFKLSKFGLRRNLRSPISALPEPKIQPKTEKALPPSESEIQQKVLGKGPQAAVENASSAFSASVKDAIKAATEAVENAPVSTIGTFALYTGVATVGTFIASKVVGSIDGLPLVPGIMKIAGITYCTTVAMKYMSGMQSNVLHPTSPVRAVLDFVDAPPSERFARAGIELPANVDPKVQQAMQQLVDQRNAAVKQVQDIRAASGDLTRLLAEKDALESVALQLAQERDSAMAELNTLRDSVESMTQRMRGIDEMLALEVKRLQEQNSALESVAFALASERDKAISELDGFRVTSMARDEEKKALEILASELIQERDDALVQLEGYKKIVADISEAAGSSSGLTSQQEVFLKNRVRSIRSQFVDVTKPYEQQRDRVELLVAHLAEEYGAPPQWAMDYMKQFLKSSAEGHALANSPVNIPKMAKNLKDTFSF